MKKVKLGLDKTKWMEYYKQADSKSGLWRSRVAGRARTIGNRVYPKRVSRVQIPPSPPKDFPVIRFEYLDFSMHLRIFPVFMLGIINLQKKEFCGFPLCFPLLTYREYKLLHSCSAVTFHLIRNVSIYIKGKRCGCVT